MPIIAGHTIQIDLKVARPYAHIALPSVPLLTRARPSSPRRPQPAGFEQWRAERLAAAVDRTARPGGRLTARNEALALFQRVKADLGDSASAEEVAREAVRRAAAGGSGVVRVARVKDGEVVVGINPEVLREACRLLASGADEEVSGSPPRDDAVFAVQILDAEEAVDAEFRQAATSQLSAGHAARLVVGLIREAATAAADNKSVLQKLKELGVVKNVQFLQQFLATFFPCNCRGRRLEPQDAQLDAMLDALEQGCEAVLAKGGFTRGGAQPNLLDVQEALNLLTVAAKHARSEGREALHVLKDTLTALEEAATDAKQLKKLLSFRKNAAGEAAQEAASFAGYVRGEVDEAEFRRLAVAAVTSVLDNLEEGGEKAAKGLKALSAIFACAVAVESPGNEEEDLRLLQAEWRANRRTPALQAAGRRRSSAVTAAAAAAAAAADTADGAPSTAAAAAAAAAAAEGAPAALVVTAAADGAPIEVAGATADGAPMEVAAAAVDGDPVVAAAVSDSEAAESGSAVSQERSSSKQKRAEEAKEPSSAPAEAHSGGEAPSQSRSADGGLAGDARRAARNLAAGAGGAAAAAAAAESGGELAAAAKPRRKKRRRTKSAVGESPKRRKTIKAAAKITRRGDATANGRSPEAAPAKRRTCLDSDSGEPRAASPAGGSVDDDAAFEREWAHAMAFVGEALFATSSD